MSNTDFEVEYGGALLDAVEEAMELLVPAQAEPDCWAVLTPNGSRLVSPQEAKGLKSAYPLYAAPAKQAEPAPLLTEGICQPNGLKFDALGEPRTRHVRVTLDGSHCVMTPQDGDRYVQDARDAGDESEYEVVDVYLSEREFDDLPEFDGF